MPKLTLGLRGAYNRIIIQPRLLSDLLKLTLGKEALNFLGPPNVETIAEIEAEWSKALLVRENKPKPKDPCFAPDLGNL